MKRRTAKKRAHRHVKYYKTLMKKIAGDHRRWDWSSYDSTIWIKYYGCWMPIVKQAVTVENTGKRFGNLAMVCIDTIWEPRSTKVLINYSAAHR